MDSKKIIEIVEELKKNKLKKYFGKVKEVDDYLKSQKVSDTDLLIIVNLLANDDVFAWLDFISSQIEIIANDNEIFISFLHNLIGKVKSDMAQGSLINALVNLGEKKPGISIKIYDAILKSHREDYVMHFAGILLGGVGKASPKVVMEYIKKILYAENDDMVRIPVKVAVIKALRIMSEKREELDDMDFYYKILNTISDTKKHEKIRSEAIDLNFQLFKFYKDVCFGHLLNLINENSTEGLKRQVADRLWVWGLGDTEKEFVLIERLSKDDSNEVIERVAYYIAKNNRENKNKTFEIFYNWVESDKDFYRPGMEYMLNEMSKTDLKFYLEKTYEKIKKEDNIKSLYTLLHLSRNLVIGNEKELEKLNKTIFDKMKKINEKR